MRHLDDQVLDQLLEPEPDEDLVQEVARHAGSCTECRQRLGEWTTLFPQLGTVLPPIPHTGVPLPRADLPRVVIPDNEPPRLPGTSHRLAWSIALVLLVAVVLLAWQLLRTREELPRRTVATSPGVAAPDTPDPSATQPAASEIPTPQKDSAAVTTEPAETQQATEPERPTRIAAELFTSPAIVVTGEPAVSIDSGPGEQSEPDRAAGLAAGMPAEDTPDEPRREPPPRDPEPEEVAPDPEPAVTRESVNFPRRQPADDAPPVRRPGQPYEAVPDDPPGLSGREVARMPATFARATMEDAASSLGGTMRAVQGLTAGNVYMAPGRIVAGARSNQVLVRLEYMTPGGTRMILDQQRLGPEFASGEASIAVSMSESGHSVAQWVDRSGYWLSLAGRMSQSALLRYANSVR